MYVTVHLSYQKWVDSHVFGPAGVSGAHGCERVRVGVASSGSHQDGFQLRSLLLQLVQRLANAALHVDQLQVVPVGQKLGQSQQQCCHKTKLRHFIS